MVATVEDKDREHKLRRRAERLGLRLRKSRARHLHSDDFGKYMVLDPDRNLILDGGRFDLELDDVEAFLDQYEANLRTRLPM
jgi:hypothetical protein